MCSFLGLIDELKVLMPFPVLQKQPVPFIVLANVSYGIGSFGASLAANTIFVVFAIKTEPAVQLLILFAFVGWLCSVTWCTKHVAFTQGRYGASSHAAERFICCYVYNWRR